MRPGAACFVWRVRELCTRHVDTQPFAAHKHAIVLGEPARLASTLAKMPRGGLLRSDASCVLFSPSSYRPWIRLDSRSSRIDTNPLRNRCPLSGTPRLKVRTSVLHVELKTAWSGLFRPISVRVFGSFSSTIWKILQVMGEIDSDQDRRVNETSCPEHACNGGRHAHALSRPRWWRRREVHQNVAR